MGISQRKIKVVRIIARLNIGGPAIHTILLSEGLGEYGFETILVVGKPDKSEGDMSDFARNKNINIKYIPELRREIGLFDLIAFFKLFFIIRKIRPDIVHTHTAKAGTLGRLAAFLAGVPVKIHTFHGHVFHNYFSSTKTRLFIFIEKILGFFTDWVIAISETQRDEIVSIYKIVPGKKCKVIRLGFDFKEFLKDNLQGKIRKELGISTSAILVGIVGRLVEIKNHKLFFDAAKVLKDKFKDTDIKFLVIGDGKLREELEKYSYEIGLGDSVKFLGWRKDLGPIYADLDIVALTSLNEGTPVSLIEAMASGKPVVSTEVGGIKDIVFEGKTGFLIKENNSSSFAEKISLLVKDRNLRQSMGKLGKEFVLKTYSKDRLFSDIKSLYEEALSLK